MLFLNTPQNPTGGVIDAGGLAALAELAEEHDLIVIVDEIYRPFNYGAPPVPSILTLPGMRERCILVDGFSKAYAMTGWRLGFGLLPTPLASRFALLALNDHACVPAFVQRAGIAALTGTQDPLHAMIKEFAARRQLVADRLAAIPGVRIDAPAGAFYAFPNVADATRAAGITCAQLATKLLHEYGVALLPGTAFGAAGEGHLRLSFATGPRRSRARAHAGARVLHLSPELAHDMSVTSAATRRVTTATLVTLRQRGEPAVWITAYDYPTAVFADRAGADVLLVGDSAAMTMLGHENTTSITMDEMLVFARAVCRGAKRALVVGDMPFLSYQVSNARAILNAGAFVAAGCGAVKIEGGRRIVPRIRAIADAGIAVMGHLGLTPQSLGQLGGYRVQGKTLAAAERLLEDTIALQEAGAFAVLLEAIPAETAAFIRERVDLLVYGIGAGPHVDGQLVIAHDVLGSFVGDIAPRFVRRYAEVGSDTERAIRAYAADVRASRFPAPEHCYPIDAADAAELRAARRPLIEVAS